MTIVNLSAEEMQKFQDHASRDPANVKLDEITVEVVTAAGGVLEKIWRLHQGQLFGQPVMMTTDECAKALGMPVSKVHQIMEPASAEIDRRWKQTDEYRRSRYAKPS